MAPHIRHPNLAHHFTFPSIPTTRLALPVILRCLQFLFGIIIAALYGVDLSHSTKNNNHASSSWIYAEVVACFSVVTSFLHFYTHIKENGTLKYNSTTNKFLSCLWDFVLMVLWAALAGFFGTMYFKDGKGEAGSDRGFTTDEKRMKAAVWIDLFCMVLWGASVVNISCCSKRGVTQLGKGLGLEEDAREHLDRPGMKDSDSKSGEKLPGLKDEKFGLYESSLKSSGLTEGFLNNTDPNEDDAPPRYEG